MKENGRTWLDAPGHGKGDSSERSESAIDSKDHVHRGFDFDRLLVEQIGAIAPGLYCVDRGLLQHRRAADDLKVLDGSRLRDRRLQNDGALLTHGLCDDWILRDALVNQ